jgi:zinc transporter ZupT
MDYFSGQYLVWAMALGGISALSLPLGSLVGLNLQIRPVFISVLQAFGAGALVAALAVELVAPTVLSLGDPHGAHHGDPHTAFYALLIGAAIGGALYFFLDQLVNAQGGFLRKTTTSIQYFRLLKKKRQLLLLEKLSQVELLQSLSPEHINTLVEAARPVAWLDGDVIFGEGDEPDWLIFILEGHVEAVSSDGILGKKGPGEVLGLALAETGLTAVGKTVARGSVKGVAVTRSDMDRLRAESPELDQACREEVKKVVDYVRERVAGWHDRSVQWLDGATDALQTSAEMPDATEFRKAKEEHSGAPLAIWLGILLDGIPESFVIGAGLLVLLRGVADLGSVTFAQVIPYTLVAGLFLSNFPEALASSATMRLQGWSKRRIFWLWASLMVITAVGAGVGFFVVESLDPTWVVFAEGVAAGAMLTMIAAAMIPEAVHLGNANVVGLSTLAGFLAAISFKLLE